MRSLMDYGSDSNILQQMKTTNVIDINIQIKFRIIYDFINNVKKKKKNDFI